MKKRNQILIALFCILILFGCSTQPKESEENILHKMNWEGKEILFYESSGLSYTDGKKTYNTEMQMLNSEDGTKRLYVTLIPSKDNISVYQDEVRIDPIDTFEYKNFEGEIYDAALTLMKQLKAVDASLELDNVHAVVYSLDTMNKASIKTESMPESIGVKWVAVSKDTMHGQVVDFTLEELETMIQSWEKAEVTKNQIQSEYGRNYQVNWKGVGFNELLFNNGMRMHIPELEVSIVRVNEKRYMEVINRMDYNASYASYYSLSEQQWSEFENWKNQLRKN